MRIIQSNRRQTILIIGDMVTLFLVTIAGFERHGELGSTGLRMMSTFIPLVAAWLLVSPHLGVFDTRRIGDPKQLWRPFWAMVLAAPLAGWMRGVWLGAAVLPLFVVIIGGISAFSILVWRSAFLVASGGRWVVDG